MGTTVTSRPADRARPRPARGAAWLYLGLIIVTALAALTARLIYLAWQERSGEAKAEAVLSLVEQRMPARPTDAPGAMAWLRLELARYERSIPDPARAARYRSLVAAGDRVPDALGGLARALQRAEPLDDGAPIGWPAPGDGADPASLRQQGLVTAGDRTVVVTRRRTLATPIAEADSPSNRFVRAAASFLLAAQPAIDAALASTPLQPVPGDRPPRPVRVYAVSEDGTLVSSPWGEPSGPGGAAERERSLLAARPGLPTFAPEEFFFRFDPSASSPAAPAYSGLYLDLGGRGLVSTILSPIVTRDGQHGVAALDLAFEIDWRALAAGVEPPVAGAAVTVPDARAASWSRLDGALGADAAPLLRSATRALATREAQTGSAGDASPLRHGLVESAGAIAAFQVSDTTWLLMLFPRTAPAFPVAAVALLGGMIALLIAGFEINRRRADDERQAAERALTEKQNLLNTMQVPLVVVDPNSDVIVSSNRAAETIGIRAGSRFADLVWPDDRSRAHYQRMQVASPEPRRAYGMPVGIRGDDGVLTRRYAIVRSVAVTAPIEALAADERHRLGVLFLIEPDADMALLAADLESHAHRDERRRLAGLLSHGVDTLARVLEHCLTREELTPSLREFVAWLSDYLERRLAITAWLLDHWDAATPLPHETIVGADQVQATMARWQALLAVVRDDRELRARLHWDNGTLSATTPEALRVEIDWPESFVAPGPVPGGFGLFLGEVVTNAVRHGRPGSVPRIAIVCDRVRRELLCSVENAVDGRSTGPPAGESYGGVAILRALARLFEWRDLAFEAGDRDFRVTWRVPLAERRRDTD